MNESKEEELTCRPLDSYAELMMFLKCPPPWSALCKELTPHSNHKIDNMDVINETDISIDAPETFCHFSPQAEDPLPMEENLLPKTLVCHDMANGYHDDSFIDGTANRDAYTFYNWAGIDIFCYFSHHLITIPPVGWINVGHAHGVKVLGTVITEWSEGIEFWDEILGSEAMFQNFAESLVTLAKLLKFDGWLLNVENKISKPQLLIEFVQYLHVLLHREIPHSELIWYDSVTIKGNLNWQNALNSKNRPFFDVCDGIFTNYSWSEADVRSSAAEAGRRVRDVYVGLDVWGRNFYGGGKFNTQEALRVVHEHGCSVAIFAPAWTHEALSLLPGDAECVALAAHLDRGQCALLRDRALWGSFWPFLSTRLPTQLPFKTSFCRGQGKKRRLYGEVIGCSPWYNLRHQQYQPNSAHGPHGYLLSSEEAVLAFSRAALLHDSDGGILRYRESFEAERAALHSCEPRTSRDLNAPLPHHEQEARSRSASPDAGASVDEPRRPSLPSKPAKRTIKEYIRGLFAAKAAKSVSIESGARPAPPSEDERRASELSADEGASMAQMSVQLRLGRASAVAPRWALAAVAREAECLQHWQEDSFTGGACLRLHPADDLSPDHRLTRLFHCDFLVEHALVACVVSKPVEGAEKQRVAVWLHARGAGGARVRVQLAPAGARRTRALLAPLEPSDTRFKDLQRHLLLNHTGFYVPIDNCFGWQVRYYEVVLPGHRITSVNVQTTESRGPVLLGHFGLCPAPPSAAPVTTADPARPPPRSASAN